MLDRWRIDDGRHLPEYVIDEDASRAAGRARWRAVCSCGRMPRHEAGVPGEVMRAHLAHVTSRTGPSRGPAWLPVGLRVALLLVVMAAVWVGCYAAGQAAPGWWALTGASAAAARLGGVLAGWAAAFGLMVGCRRWVAPTARDW